MDSTLVQRQRINADIVALLVVTIWGASFAFQKVALAQFGTSAFMCARYLGMLILSWAVLLYYGRRTREPIGIGRGDLAGLALAGALGYTFYIPLSTFGLNYTTAFSNALLIALAPLFAVVLLRLLRLEPVTGSQYAGMLVALAGAAVFVLPALRLNPGSAGIGDLLSLAGAAFFAGYTVASKPLLPRHRLPAMMAYTLTIGAVPVIAALAPSLATAGWDHVTAGGWAAFVWTVVVPVYLAWSLWNWTIGRIGVARASLFMYLVPVAGGLTSWIVFGEGFGALKLAGAALVLTGLGIARRRGRDDEASNDGTRQRHIGFAALAEPRRHRDHPENRRRRGHQNRAEARPAGAQYRVADGKSARPQFVGVVHEQNAVAEHNADHGNHAHERHDGPRRAREQQHPDDADDAERHRKHDDEWIHERLEPRDHDHVHEHECEQHGGGQAGERTLLLLGLPGHMVREPRRKGELIQAGLHVLGDGSGSPDRVGSAARSAFTT